MTADEAERHLPPHLRRRCGKRLTDLQLSEISVVTMPANPGAMALLHKSNAFQEVPMTAVDQAYIEASARAAVAAALAKMEGDAAAAAASLARLTAGSVQKGGQDGAAVAEAVQAAQAGEDRPADYWRRALARLGETLLPEGTATDRMQAAMASRDGRALVGALTGDKRLLAVR